MTAPYDPNGPFQPNPGGGGIRSLLRLLLGRRAERPQDPSAYDPTTVSRHAMRSASPERPSRTAPRSAPPVPGAPPRRARSRRFGALRFLPHVIVAGAAAIGGITSLAQQHSSVSIPHLGKVFEPTCPRPAAGVDVLEDERTDCTALDPAELFSTDTVQDIQGHRYRSLGTDGTDLCASLATLPADRGTLTRNGCRAVARELFVGDRTGAFGGVAIIVFDDGVHARAAFEPRAGHSPVRMLGTPTGERGRGLPPRLDQVRGVEGSCSHPGGRYLVCTRVSPVGRDGVQVSLADQQALRRDMSFAALDPLVARRFRSL